MVWTLVWLRVGGGGPYAAHLGPGQADDEPSAGDVPTVSADGARPTVPFRRIVTTGTWLGATFSTFAVMWTLSLGFAWLPLFLEDQVGFSDAEISGIVGLPALSMAVLVLTAGAVAHRLLRRGVTARVAQGLVGALLPLLAGLCLLLATRAGPAPSCCRCWSWRSPRATDRPPDQRGDRGHVPRPGAAPPWASRTPSPPSRACSPPMSPGGSSTRRPPRPPADGRAFDLAACLLIAGAVVSALLIRPDRDALTLLAAHPATSSASAASSVSAASSADAEPTAKE
ncbi:hypothetical protein WKI71_06095 [Streptomyces sp. MS1.AVA.1]|uniref:MFS transporter n=1 Tax=Streptomyces machairae TaxID=3134109 RepID=A0ABU8UH92_9ACTN